MSLKRVMAALAALALVLLVACSRSSTTNVPAMQDAVTDTAGKLSPTDDAALETRITAYRNRTGNEIAVLLIGSLGDESIEDVAYRTFNTWGIGKKGKDNGVLLAIAPNERKTRIETGKGVGHLLTDVECGRILRERLGPYLKQDRFREGIEATLDAIEAVLDERALPPPPASLHAAPYARGMYVIAEAGTLGDSVVATLEEEIAREGTLFSNIAIVIVPGLPNLEPHVRAANAPSWSKAHAEMRQLRMKARLDADPMLVIIGVTPRAAAVRPITVIQHERVKTLGPRFEAAVRSAPSVEEAVRAVAREQIAFARAESERAAAQTAENAADAKRSNTALIVVIVALALFVGALIWFVIWAVRRGEYSGYEPSSSDAATSYSSFSSDTSNTSTSTDTSYSGGGGRSGGGGASDSY
ncbi:MAG: TPM domain-containing protein [Labilithrix sp.]|nr:TPM domain-containing protein [Labilithrix sp.]MCW5810971.1 TPM domain-containing protein [Labilithrix sp.]